MHPEKSRLVRFRRPRLGWRPGQNGDRFPPPGTFDFLGFTHYWCIARNGSWVLKRKTAKDRLRRSLTAVNRWCCTHRHASIATQHRMLVWKLRGHCAYFGILEPDDVRLPRRAHLAKVAQPSVAAEVNAVDAVPPPSRAISSSADDGRSLRHRRVAKPSAEEPDAEEPACPDLWGAGVSNDPGLPDPMDAPRAGGDSSSQHGPVTWSMATDLDRFRTAALIFAAGTCGWRITTQPRNPVSVSSFVILGEVARMCRCATRSSCSST